MVNSVTATYAKNNLGGLMDKVISTRKKILIKKGGKPAVFIVPVETDFELNLTEKEIKGIELGMKDFRKSFRFNF